MSIALGPRLIQKAKFFAPWIGRWVLEVHFDGAPPSGKVTVQWGKTAMTGTVLPDKSGSVVGQGVATIVGGAGWHQEPTSTWLVDTMAAPSRVAQQLAAAVGETLVIESGAIREGRAVFSRANQPASLTLESLLSKEALWWVDFAGVTHAGLDRTDPSSFDPTRVLLYEPSTRLARLDIEEPSEAPVGAEIPADGERFELAQRIRELRMEADETGVQAWASFELPTTRDPRLASILKRISHEENLPPHATIRAATVQSQDVQRRVSLRYEERDKGLADPLPVPLWAGLPGASAELFAGTRVLVAFDRADPTNPIAMMSSPYGQAGHVPQKVYLEANQLIQLLAASAGIVKVGVVTKPLAKAEDLSALLGALQGLGSSLSGNPDPSVAAVGAALTAALASVTVTPTIKLEAE